MTMGNTAVVALALLSAYLFSVAAGLALIRHRARQAAIRPQIDLAVRRGSALDWDRVRAEIAAAAPLIVAAAEDRITHSLRRRAL